MTLILRPYQQDGLNALCSIEHCNKPIFCKDVCENHYRRFKRNGNATKFSKYEANRKIAKEKWEEAKSHGLKFYYTGIPCTRGHISRKFTRGARCEACYLEDIKNTKRARKYFLQANYKLTQEQYDEMCKSQNGVCAICFKHETRILRGKATVLSVDHCHETNKIRKLLCNRCNNAIGAFEHNPKLLKQAALYCEEN